MQNSGFGRQHMTEAALAMQYVQSQEGEPSPVIRDPMYVKESSNYASFMHIFNGRWLVGLVVAPDKQPMTTHTDTTVPVMRHIHFYNLRFHLRSASPC